MKEQDRETYEQLLKKRDENGWTQDEFHDALRDKGAKVQNSQVKIELNGHDKQHEEDSTKDKGKISIQKVQENNLWCDLTITAFRFEDFGKFEWNWDTRNDFSFGVPPWDLPSVSWLSSDYVYNGGSYGGNMYLWRRQASKGAVVRYNDSNAIGSSEQGSDHYTVYLDRQSTGKRRLYARYRHTWNSVNVDSVTFGTGGVSISFSNESNVWKKFLNTEI